VETSTSLDNLNLRAHVFGLVRLAELEKEDKTKSSRELKIRENKLDHTEALQFATK